MFPKKTFGELCPCSYFPRNFSGTLFLFLIPKTFQTYMLLFLIPKDLSGTLLLLLFPKIIFSNTVPAPSPNVLGEQKHVPTKFWWTYYPGNNRVLFLIFGIDIWHAHIYNIKVVIDRDTVVPENFVRFIDYLKARMSDYFDAINFYLTITIMMRNISHPFKYHHDHIMVIFFT